MPGTHTQDQVYRQSGAHSPEAVDHKILDFEGAALDTELMDFIRNCIDNTDQNRREIQIPAGFFQLQAKRKQKKKAQQEVLRKMRDDPQVVFHAQRERDQLRPRPFEPKDQVEAAHDAVAELPALPAALYSRLIGEPEDQDHQEHGRKKRQGSPRRFAPVYAIVQPLRDLLILLAAHCFSRASSQIYRQPL